MTVRNIEACMYVVLYDMTRLFEIVYRTINERLQVLTNIACFHK